MVLSKGTVIFSYSKYFHYEDPKLSCMVEGDGITMHADTYAKSVEIQHENEDLVLSDNYFDRDGGSRRVQIVRGQAENLRLYSVYEIR